MKVEYSKHIKNRMKLRRMEYDLPKRIFEEAEERYFDEETGYFIAVIRVVLYEKKREVMVAYSIEDDYATLLTIHPLKKGQKENRIKTGRWRKI
jgi:hypothetical protein